MMPVASNFELRIMNCELFGSFLLGLRFFGLWPQNDTSCHPEV